MRLVVPGANGLLGSNVVKSSLERDHDVRATFHSTEPAFSVPLEPLDITTPGQVETYLEETDPDAVVNCAAMTDVDGCESRPERAMAVNADAPGRMARWCEENDSQFTHVSTDYVFDGQANAPYSETAEVNPIQEYGRSKLAGEREVREAMEAPLLVRLSFVWGVHRGHDELHGFPAWVRDSVKDGEETPLFTDQHISPSRAGQAATAIIDLLESSASGTYHVAARSCVTPYEFGELIRDRTAEATGRLVESSMGTLDRPAERPSYTCLDVTRVKEARDENQPTLAADLNAVDDYI